MLTPRTMQALLAGPDVDWRIEGPLILSWRSGHLAPLELLAQIATLNTVLAGVPSFVWKDHGYDPGGAPSDPTPSDPTSFDPNTERPAS